MDIKNTFICGNNTIGLLERAGAYQKDYTCLHEYQLK